MKTKFVLAVIMGLMIATCAAKPTVPTIESKLEKTPEGFTIERIPERNIVIYSLDIMTDEIMRTEDGNYEAILKLSVVEKTDENIIALMGVIYHANQKRFIKLHEIVFETELGKVSVPVDMDTVFPKVLKDGWLVESVAFLIPDDCMGQKESCMTRDELDLVLMSDDSVLVVKGLYTQEPHHRFKIGDGTWYKMMTMYGLYLSKRGIEKNPALEAKK